MRKVLTSILILGAFSFGLELEGIITGAGCALKGMTCPKEHLFKGYELLGLYDVKGKRFYYLINVPQRVLSYLFSERVKVVGKKLSGDSLKVKELKVGGKVFKF